MPIFGGNPQDPIDEELSRYHPNQGAFTSDLTGQEFWLVLDKGYLPVGLVLGNCVFSMGAMRDHLSRLRAVFRGELSAFSQLLYDARALAMKRMKDEADALGADGVVGVHLSFQEMHDGQIVEVTAVGTAVRYVGHPEGESGHGSVVIPTN